LPNQWTIPNEDFRLSLVKARSRNQKGVYKMSHILKRKRFVFIAVTVLLLVMVSAASAQHCQTVQGLVFMDDNMNGVWDVGEAGYSGEMQTVEEDDGWMHDQYVGATVTIYTPAYDDFVLESAGYTESGEEPACCHQDAMLDEEVENPNQVRPCLGTWGLPGIPDDIRLEVWVTAPEGYVLTSENPQYFITGEDSKPLDFGLAPVDEAKDVIDAKAADEEDKAVESMAYSFSPKGTGFVYGLVFIDENENGVWDVGEAGYGGEVQLVEEDDGWMHEEYVGATIKLTSPAYDEVKVTSAPYKEPEEDKALCTPQDYGETDDLNEHPLRPCAGTWGITQAGDNVYWVVDITAPEGYRLTSPNPQYYITGSGDPFVDFGIVPIDAE
jgi:hypothetical protein